MSREQYLEKPLPSSDESERVILGSILLDNAVISQAAEDLIPDDFYSPLNRRVFAAMLSLLHQQKAIDPILIGEELKKDGDLAAIGGVTAIANLTFGLPYFSNIAEYIKVVKDASKARALLRVCNKVIGEVLSEEDPIAVVLERAEQSIFALSTVKATSVEELLHPLAVQTLGKKVEQIRTGMTVTGMTSGLRDVDAQIGGYQRKDLILVGGRPSMGKAQPLDAKVLTPAGFRFMGELSLGDRVASVNSRPSFVTGVFPQGEAQVYRITFSDGRSTECCSEHLWQIYYRSWPSPRVVSTTELMRLLRRQRYRNRLWIDVFQGEFGSDEGLRIDPCLLGVLLGDGCIAGKSVLFSTADSELLQNVEAVIQNDWPDLTVSHQAAYDYRIRQKNRGHHPGVWGTVADSNPLKIALAALGLSGAMSGDKFIPERYLTATRRSRMRLLAGLIDTDGWVETFGSIRFSTASIRLAQNLTDLVRSLGGTASFSLKEPEYTYKKELRFGKMAYICNLQLPNALQLKLLARKQDRLRPSPRRRRVTVQSITPTRITATQCITVSHPSKLYITDDYIVTHNTSLVTKGIVDAMLADTSAVGIFFSAEMSKEQVINRIICQYADINLWRFNHNHIRDTEWQHILNIVAPFEGINFYIDDTPRISVMQMLAKARRVQAKHKRLDIAAVDHIGLMTPANPRESRVNQITQLSGDLKAFAKTLDVPTVALSQLSREVDKRNPPIPELRDLRDSGSLEQDADVVMFVYRPEYYNREKGKRPAMAEEAQIIVAKQRNGPTDTVPVRWISTSAKFVNLDRDEDGVVQRLI